MSQETPGSHADYHPHSILLGGAALDYRLIELDDPVPTGRQILAAAGYKEQLDYVLCAVLDSGDFEEVRLDEIFDLRGRGVERFIVFQTDRTYRLTLNGHQLVWGEAQITGEVLYKLSGASRDEAVFLEVRGGQDKIIEPSDNIHLEQLGVEHFITTTRQDPGFVITVNTRDEVVMAARVTYEQVVQLAFPGAPDQANVCFSMTYRNAASSPHAGELSRGGAVEAKRKGTVFNVTRTVQS